VWAAVLVVAVPTLIVAVMLRPRAVPVARQTPAPLPVAAATASPAPRASSPAAATAMVFPPPLRTRIEPAERALPAPAQPSPSWHEGARGHDEAVQEQRDTRLPMLVHFRVDWDPQGPRFERRILGEPEMEKFLAGAVKLRLEPERSPEEAAIAQEYHVPTFPSLYLVPAPGAEPVRVPTFAREDDTTAAAEKLAAELHRVMVAHARGLLADGQTKLNGGDAAGARAAFDAVLAIEPRELEALLWRSQAHVKLQETALAMGDLTRAIAVAPEDPRAYVQLATMYAELEQHEDAADVLDSLVGAAPQWRQGRAYVMRAETRQRLKRKDEAREDFRVACDQGNAYACQQLGP
jgi:tetratricopeptide (TPR) repeat protein